MASADQAGAVPSLPAIDIDLRLFASAGRLRADRTRFAVALLVCFLVHIAFLIPLPFFAQEYPPIEEAIPVEILNEPPEPTPPQEAEKEEEPPAPQPEQKPLDEKPATDAARSADADDKAAARAEEKPAEQKPPEPQQVAEPDPQPPAFADVPLPPRIPQSRPFSDFSMPPLPDMAFEPPARRMNFPGGNADPSYLSTLYGMIMQHMFTPQTPPPNNRVQGRVAFAVASDGRIFQAAVTIPSGMPELDRAALSAVRRAAPFPPPPNGGPLYLHFDYQPK